MDDKKFVTPNPFSKEMGIPRDFLRARIARGEVPGFRSGNRFYINRELFLRQLEAECMRNAATEPRQ